MNSTVAAVGNIFRGGLPHLRGVCVLVVKLLLRMSHSLLAPRLLPAHAVYGMLSVVVVAAAAEQKRSYDLPRGEAATMLARFAEQSGRPVLFAMDKVRGARTNAVVGEFSPAEALDRLLAETELIATIDRATGDIVVSRRPPPAPPGGRDSAPPKTTPTKTAPETKIMPTASPLRRATAWLALLAAQVATAQTVPASNPSEEKAIELSPFQVTADRDSGYTAASTLAGSRLNSELRNSPAAISVMTKQFLDDIGGLNTTEALAYALNGTRDFSDLTGGNVAQFVDVGVKIRGFTGATLTRNFFNCGLSSDVYNTERLDFARGPNSILFGIGSPAGIIDTTTKRARFDKPITAVQTRVGSWEDYRTTFDIDRKINEVLAVRLNAIWQDRKSWREFEMQKRTGATLAASYRPLKHTEVRVEAEYGDVAQILFAPFPAGDAVTPWLAAGKPVSVNNTTAVAGTATNSSRALIYDPFGSTGPVSWFGSRTMNPAALVPSNLFVARAFTDESILPRSAMLYGPGANVNFWYSNYSVFVEQRVGHLSMELAANRNFESRDVDTPLVYNVANLRADANALLPSVALPNGQPAPGAGLPNPNVGRFYVESTPAYRIIENKNEQVRATLAYDLNLTERNAWLGRHRFAGLVSRMRNYFYTDSLVQNMVNPPGTGFYPADLTNSSNRILRRNYLDFSQPDPRFHAMHDPRRYPINNLNGVTARFVRVGNGSSPSLSDLESGLLALESVWWNDRLHVTTGLRRDNQSNFSAGAVANRDPITGEFLPRGLQATADSEFAGNTRTYGVVFHAASWLSLFYNNANNFVPQRPPSIGGGFVGPQQGKGQDFGIRFYLSDGRMNLLVNRYSTTRANVVLGSTNDTTLIAAINEIWATLGQFEKTISTQARDSVSNAGEGWEVELTANPTKQWRFTANFSQADLKQADTYLKTGALIAANRALFQQNGSLPLQPPLNISVPPNPTLKDAVALTDQVLALIRASDGQIPRQHRKYSANVFTTYTFSGGSGWLRGVMMGGGANYAGKSVVGYSGARGGAPIWGNEFILLNAVVGRTFKLGKTHNLHVQLNVNNLLDEDNYVILDKNDAGTAFYRYQQPRSWSVTSSFTF